MRTLGIYVKTTLRDLQSFVYLQEDLMRFHRIRGPIVVSVPDAHLDKFRPLVSRCFRLITDTEILRSAGLSGLEDNWFSQQLMKLLVSALFGDCAYLALDSNTVLNDELTEQRFMECGRWNYEIQRSSGPNALWRTKSAQFLQMTAPLEGFDVRPVNQVLIPSQIKLLGKRLEELYSMRWQEVLSQSCVEAYRDDRVIWTEFHLYGLYNRFFSTQRDHCYTAKNTLRYFIPVADRVDLGSVSSEFRRQAVFMVKAYKHHSGISLSDADYADVATTIRLACRAKR
jgi:hypothetical protein